MCVANFFTKAEQSYFSAWFDIAECKNPYWVELPKNYSEEEIQQLILQTPRKFQWANDMYELTTGSFKSRSKAKQTKQRVCLEPNGWSVDLSISQVQWIKFWTRLNHLKFNAPNNFDYLHRYNLGYRHHNPIAENTCDICKTTVSNSELASHIYLSCTVAVKLWEKLGPPLPLTFTALVANPNLSLTNATRINRYLQTIDSLRTKRRTEPVNMSLTGKGLYRWVSYFTLTHEIEPRR